MLAPLQRALRPINTLTIIGSKMLRRLSETSVGHPETYLVEADYKTNCSDLDLSYFCSQIAQFAPRANTICEIGGGYGGYGGSALKLNLRIHDNRLFVAPLRSPFRFDS